MNQFTDSKFVQYVITELERLDRAIEKAAEIAHLDLEINRDGGLLEIECEDRSKIVITSQTARNEIWVAAKAGGFHFHFDQQKQKWLDTRDQSELYQKLAKLITEQSGTDFTLSD